MFIDSYKMIIHIKSHKEKLTIQNVSDWSQVNRSQPSFVLFNPFLNVRKKVLDSIFLLHRFQLVIITRNPSSFLFVRSFFQVENFFTYSQLSHIYTVQSLHHKYLDKNVNTFHFLKRKT